jgi:glycosyltransferase involved in cell wall biosynthesis
MRILHCPSPIARQPWLLSRTQRKFGFQSDVMVFAGNPLWDYKYEYNFHLEKFNGLLKKMVAVGKTSFFVPKALAKYDLFHFHTKSIIPGGYDALVAKKLGKKIVFHMHGCEIRLTDSHGFCRVCQAYGKKYKLHMIKTVNKLADLVIIATPDLFDEMPNATWIPNSVDLENWQAIEKKEHDDKIKIIHSTGDRDIKGTVYIESAVNDLKKEGYNIELILLENVSNEEIKEIAAHADIAVDQLMIGSYGVGAIETMSLGIPTCAYIREDLIEKYPKNLPIINANGENIKEKLRILIEDSRLRGETGKDSVKFVQENHDCLKNGKKMIDLYNQLE